MAAFDKCGPQSQKTYESAGKAAKHKDQSQEWHNNSIQMTSYMNVQAEKQIEQNTPLFGGIQSIFFPTS